MQANDNNKNPLDDQFFDQAWENMREALDREMPVKKKRRRFLPWFYLMAGAVVGLFFWIGISSLNQNDLEHLTANNSNVSPIVKIDNKANTTTSIDLENTQTNNTITKNSSIQNEKKSNNVPQQIITKNHRSTTAIVPQQNIYNKTNPTTLNNSDNPIPQKNKLINPNIPPLAMLNSVNTLLENQEDLLDIKLKEDYLKIKEPENLCPPKRKIGFEINAGLAYDFSAPKKIGFTTSGLVHFPIGEKWGIKTGLGYSVLAKNEKFSVSENQEVILAQNNPTTSFADLSLYRLNVQEDYVLKNIHYLEIPLAATFEINKKWEILTGVNLSKSIKETLTSNGTQNFSLIDNDPNTTLELMNVRTNNVGSPNVPDELWKNDFVSGLLGISWNPSRRLSFNLLFYQGILTLNSKEEDLSADAFQIIPNSGNTLADIHDQNSFLIKNPRSLRFTVGYKF